MSEETTNLTVLARQEAERRRTLIALVIAGVALAFAVWWGVTKPFEPSPGPDPAATDSPIPTTAPIPQGRVTAAAGLPDALPLTDAVLAQVESLWSLVTFRGNVVTEQGTVLLGGPTVLYLVSPVGEVYEVTNMDTLRADALVAWDSRRDVALLAFNNNTEVRSYSLTTGAVGPAIDPCDGGTPLAPSTGTVGEANWRLYTYCVDGDGDFSYLHSASVGDRGDLVWDNSVVYVPLERSLKVSGDVHITSAIDRPAPTTDAPSPSPTPASRQWIEVDGAELEAPSPPNYPVCDVVGAGRNGTVVAHCVNARAGFLWELPTDGSIPIRVMRVHEFPVDAMGEEMMRVTSCAAGDALAVQWASVDGAEGALTLIQGQAVTTVAINQQPATHCFGVSGIHMLIGGPEGLAFLDTTTGAVRQLITAPTPQQLGLDPGEWVGGVVATEPNAVAGAEHQGVILAP
ncbi:MAG: hypothetical protein CVT64_00700 [Actinobacteria bacterium HGW-Actinobacteria-4]|nr:MAG: hypothetical protein CVT64_00700 [Actinobacteria bacterium HGW-Actinobacteria-4]